VVLRYYKDIFAQLFDQGMLNLFLCTPLSPVKCSTDSNNLAADFAVRHIVGWCYLSVQVLT
jgi:hypothetical protein